MDDTSTGAGSAGVLVVGAGPAGLAAARALTARDIPYDHVERHDAVGGIWDIDAPGSPMYEAAHFISSRTLSGFEGFPMPDDYPDYPSHRQVLAYLRSFADAYGLTGRIRFGTTVERVDEDAEGGWTAHLDDGTSRRYQAVICCSGAQWTPSLPELPGHYAGEHVHSQTYRDLDQLRGRRVLVVGGGNSACDIVVDAARAADRAVISMRGATGSSPSTSSACPPTSSPSRGRTCRCGCSRRRSAPPCACSTAPRTAGACRSPTTSSSRPTPCSTATCSWPSSTATSRPVPGSPTATAAGHLHRRAQRGVRPGRLGHRLPARGALRPGPPRRPPAPRPLPDLVLAEHEGLYGIGFTETNSGAYRHFDALAQMVASHLDDRVRRPDRYREFERMIRTDRPDLSNGIRFDSSPRHAGYVDADALTRYRAKVVRRLGWRTQVPAGSRRVQRRVRPPAR